MLKQHSNGFDEQYDTIVEQTDVTQRLCLLCRTRDSWLNSVSAHSIQQSL